MNIEKLKAAYEKGYRIVNNTVINTRTGKIRKTFHYKINKGCSPYPRFTICYNKKRISIWAHQLAAYQKYGEKACIRADVVRHKSNNILNFSTENVLLGTQSENIMDQNPDMRREKAIRASKAAVNKIRFNKYRYAVLEYMEDF